MDFLNPAFLFALAAAAVPLLIHLLSRKKAREVPFSSLRFLERSDRRSMRRINLRRLLLLALRTAAIALIALAFARPVITGRTASLFPGREPKAVVIMIDRSYSMGLRGSGGTAFESAVSAALDIAGGLEDDDELTVALFDEGTEEIFSAERAGRAAAEGALAGAAPSMRGTDLRAAAARGTAILESGRRNARELFIISDFQRSGTGARGAGEGHRGVRAFLVPVAAEGGPNVAIEKVILPGAPLHREEAVTIRAYLRNTSPDYSASFPLRVEADGRGIFEKEIELPPGASTEETFEFDAGRAGWLRGSVSCREDMLPADDTRLFALLVREKTPVLLLGGQESFYLAQALAPDGADGDIDLTTRGWESYTTADLARADVLVAGPGGSTGSDDAALVRRFAEDGGRALVFISPGMESFVEEMSGHPVSLEALDPGDGFVELERPGRESPLLSVFSDADVAAMSRLRFTRTYAVRGLPRGTEALRFSDGSPFVWAERAGAGEVVFSAAEPTPAAGDLVLSPFFLPMVQQMALAALSVSPGREGALIGSTVEIPLEGGGCEIELPGGGEYVDPPVTAAGRVSVPAGGEQGYITARCGDLEWQTAVNPDCSRESELGSMSPREAADSLGLEAWTSAPAGSEISEAVREAREGREIADALIIAAALLLAVELAVAQSTGRREAEEAA